MEKPSASSDWEISAEESPNCAIAYGANIIYNEIIFIPPGLRADFKGTPVSLDELLTQSDIVTLHIPSLAANRAMMGGNSLSG